MASLLTASKRLLSLGLWCVLPSLAWAQTFSPQGGEYSLGTMPGDQLFPNVSITTNGGYVVWEDSVIDGNGRGIGALQLDNNLSPRFGAFRVNQRTAGNQEKPQVAMLKKGGAAIVWQGGGQKFANVYARFLNSAGTFTGTNDIRVNSTTNTDQLAPALTVMSNGNVFVVWSSWNYSTNTPLMQDVRAQILTTNGALVGTNFYINGTNPAAPTELYNQRSPAVATLANGNIVVAWVSESQGLSSFQLQQGANWVHVYARLYNPVGAPIGPEFLVSSELYSLCANPAVSGTTDSGFTVVWSQRAGMRTAESWDVYGRTFAADGISVAVATRLNSFPVGDQFGPRICTLSANQVVAWTSLGQDSCREGIFGKAFVQGLGSGQELREPALLVPEDFPNVPLLVSQLASGSADPVSQFLWGQFSSANKQALTNPNTPLAQKQSILAEQLNTMLQGSSIYTAERFSSVILSLETSYLLAQNPQGEELVRFNRLLLQDALWVGPSCADPQLGAFPQVIRRMKSSINTTTISRQMHPAIASDGAGRILVVWASFVGESSFDLYAQRYASGQQLPQPSAPFVSALSQYALGVTWPELSGYPLSYYEVYQDGSTTSPAATTTNNMWVASGLAPGSTHSFQLAYVLAGGQRSVLSPPTTNRTWGVDMNGKLGTPDGLPDDWQTFYFGSKTADWDGPNVDSDGDGASNWQEFLAGTNPRDPNSVLKTRMTSSTQGRRLSWNTVAGCVYQVQLTTDFEAWSDFGSPRLAAGTTDSVSVAGVQGVGYYRVIRVQ